MSPSNPLILQVHLDGAEPYEIGDEIWQQPLCDAIRDEAETIADYAGQDSSRCLAEPAESRCATTSSSK